MASVQRSAPAAERRRDLYAEIGRFLAEHGLSPDPRHYAFAHNVLVGRGALADEVAALTDGGVRLTTRDIERLSGTPSASGARGAMEGPAAEASVPIETLVARTQMQVEGFSDMMDAIHSETLGFGRDLAASAAAIREGNGTIGLDEVVRLTGAMVGRVRTAEARLEAARSEASELREKLEEARDNARRDPLTDLPNRRAFQEAFSVRHAAGKRMCIAVCDVDQFKAVNDRFGHAVGDRVLKAISEALSKACAGQFVARFGGEEFVVLFDDIEPASALATLDNARCMVAERRFRLRETDAPLGRITFSAGLTSAAAGEALDLCFGRADRLLYEAKNAGRNRVTLG